MSWLHALASLPIRAIDRLMRRRLGIWEFSTDPSCILRLGITTAHTRVELADGTVIRPGDTVGVIHLWNERLPRIPASGPDLAWARRFWQLLSSSFHLLAQFLAQVPDLAHIQALGGELPLPFTPATVRMLNRLGLEVFAPLSPHGLIERVTDAGARIWTWLLRWAFNPASVHGQRPGDLERRPTWISRRTLLARFGPDT